ncbi:DUF222 domain-containing protein [Streptomyces sp. NPDC004647]|uniref:DUF222 domain-containing protein n=1 Tax=Streptomyces sp. NPDC004647 TaxID=3154671 RepID=UPI0033BA5E91
MESGRGGGVRLRGQEVASALHLSNATAGDRLDIARELDGRFPTTLGMLERGKISYMQARAVADTCSVLVPLDVPAATLRPRIRPATGLQPSRTARKSRPASSHNQDCPLSSPRIGSISAAYSTNAVPRPTAQP